MERFAKTSERVELVFRETLSNARDDKMSSGPAIDMATCWERPEPYGDSCPYRRRHNGTVPELEPLEQITVAWQVEPVM